MCDRPFLTVTQPEGANARSAPPPGARPPRQLVRAAESSVRAISHRLLHNNNRDFHCLAPKSASVARARLIGPPLTYQGASQRARVPCRRVAAEKQQVGGLLMSPPLAAGRPPGEGLPACPLSASIKAAAHWCTSCSRQQQQHAQ
jgi:hypothetical protein